MQISVSKIVKRNGVKTRTKSVISTILIFLFAIVSTAILVNVRKKSLVFDEQYFYFVSVSKSNKKTDFEAKKELLKNLGGASVVYKLNGEFHLIANVYLDLNFAEEIKNNLLSYFQDASVVKVKTKKVKGSVRRNIKANKNAESFLKFMYGLSKDFHEIELEYLSGKISDGKFLSIVSGKRLELEKKLDNLQSSDDLSKQILGFGELFLLQMTNFLTNFSLYQSKQNYICNYFVGFFVNFIELYDSLQ